jgi:uncharacterized FlaG/YvyC family protein
MVNEQVQQSRFDDDSSRGSTPSPDPTVLTTEQLDRASKQLNREIDALRTLIDQRINAAVELFDVKIMLGREGGMALKELIETKFEALQVMLNERYATQTKALDAAFLAQQAAVATSFDASEKAVAAALLAAEKAVEKANAANEKRFESVNEFREQLNDMIRTLLSRTEADAKFQALDTRASDNKDAIAAIRAVLAGDMGSNTGVKESRDASQGRMAIMIAIAGLVLTLVFIMVTLFAVYHH